MNEPVLIAEDDADMGRLIKALAEEAGFEGWTAADVPSALDMLAREPALIMTDLRMPGGDGLEVIRQAKAHLPDVPVVLVTGYASAREAVEAFRLGVMDVILKPFDMADVRRVFHRVREQLDRTLGMERLSRRLAQVDIAEPPVVRSPAMRQVMELVDKVADTDIPVLLGGETGVGKGTLARFIHDLGGRRDAPFFTLDCAGISSSLTESELFGHEKGAFTGAAKRKLGLLELAAGGTLFLDEVNSLPADIQGRLLQFLQEKTLMRVGGQRKVTVDTRLLFASNEPLEDLVEAGRFRADLFYRINVFPVRLPPLRERPEDIPELVDRLLARVARQLGRTGYQLTSEALEAILAHHWPGNVRELENALQRALILADDERIVPGQLPIPVRGETAERPCPEGASGWPWLPDTSLEAVERFWINHLLESTGGNRAETARRLGIDVTTLYRKLRRMAD